MPPRSIVLCEKRFEKSFSRVFLWRSLDLIFPHFLLFGKKRSQKSEAGLCPAPAALPTAFYGRRGSFLLTHETPMEHGFHRLVGVGYERLVLYTLSGIDTSTIKKGGGSKPLPYNVLYTKRDDRSRPLRNYLA